MMFFDHAIDVRGFVVTEIQHVEHRLASEKLKAAEHLQLFRFEVEFAQRRFALERFATPGQNLQLSFEYRLFLFLQIFFHALDSFGGLFQIVQHQLDFNALDIAQGIERAAFVWHRGVFK